MLECVTRFSGSEERKQRYRELAKKLNRQKCVEPLSKCGPVDTIEMPDDTHVEYLIAFLLKYPEQLGDEIIPLLNANPNTINGLTHSDSMSPYI